MKIIPGSRTSSLKPIKVVFEKNSRIVPVFISRESSITYNFRCIQCTLLLFLVDKEIKMVIPSGEYPLDALKFDVECPRCNTIYRLVW